MLYIILIEFQHMLILVKKTNSLKFAYKLNYCAYFSIKSFKNMFLTRNKLLKSQQTALLNSMAQNITGEESLRWRGVRSCHFFGVQPPQNKLQLLFCRRFSEHFHCVKQRLFFRAFHAAFSTEPFQRCVPVTKRQSQRSPPKPLLPTLNPKCTADLFVRRAITRLKNSFQSIRMNVGWYLCAATDAQICISSQTGWVGLAKEQTFMKFCARKTFQQPLL